MVGTAEPPPMPTSQWPLSPNDESLKVTFNVWRVIVRVYSDRIALQCVAYVFSSEEWSHSAALGLYFLISWWRQGFRVSHDGDDELTNRRARDF